MPYGQGDLPLGLADAKVAAYNDTDDYGSLTDVMSVEMSRGTMQLVSAIARGDDRITAAAAVIEGVELVLRFTGLNLAAMAVLTGKTMTTISSVLQMQFVGGEHMPYFGAIIKAISADGTDVWVFFPQCKVMSNFTFFQGEYGTFGSPELTIQVVPDETWGVANVITHPSEVAITVIPPANIAEVP
jgi:hypothetical protein